VRVECHNLPGNWESSKFNLPALHNDAVVQGQSEVPFTQEVKRWGVMTIGTGLGSCASSSPAPFSARVPNAILLGRGFEFGERNDAEVLV
jgi:hypothetical protein